MEFFCFGEEDWATFIGIVTNGDYKVKVDVAVFVDVVGSMGRNINTVFFHDGDSVWVYAMGFDSGTINFSFVAGKIP